MAALGRAAAPSRRWCITIFDDDTWRALVDFEEHVWPDELRFLIGQYEAGEHGRGHFQAYLELFVPQRFSWIKHWLGDDQVHCESARGTAHENIAYCSKEEGRIEGPWSYGEPSAGQGHRTDISECKDLIDAGADDLTVAGTYFESWCRYERSFNKYRHALAVRALGGIRDRPEVRVFWGATGTGKSYAAFEAAGPLAWWFSPPSSKGGPVWWDGYDGQADIIIDDFDGEFIPIALMLRVLDRYPVQLAVKGGFVPCAFRRVWITSNIEPERWYGSLPEGDRRRAALERRLTEVTHRAVVFNV